MDSDRRDNTETNVLLGALILAILLFLGLSVYYFLASRKSPSLRTAERAVPPGIQKKLDAGAAEFKKTIKNQEVDTVREAKAFRDECRLTSVDPKNGAERIQKTADGVTDYNYTLKIINAETVSLTKKNAPCRYVKLSLRPNVINSSPLIIYLPAGITYDMGTKVSPLIYTTQVGMTVTMQLTVQDMHDAQNPYKILAWRPLRSYVN